MPYIEVWVDEPSCDCECDGKCKSAEMLSDADDRIDAALLAIRESRWADVEPILNKSAYVEPRSPKSKIIEAYEAWKKGQLSGFTKLKAPRE
jgi:hypothetical protein